MMIEPIYIAKAIAVGAGATLVMDLWAVFLKRVFSIPSLNYCLVGRWMGHMPDGVFRHTNIATAQQKRGECTVGWVAHYGIGIVYALALVLIVSPLWLHQPTVLPALLIGLVTVTIPFFLMQPAFGMGIAASKTPNPLQARLRSLMTHAVFGLGLYVSALALSVFFQA
ncbi:MAG: DUF2938 domain-containing protein [Alcanivorax sp.]|nr:DUF2938 domain-containing protein [Alcanivorax sp.]